MINVLRAYLIFFALTLSISAFGQSLPSQKVFTILMLGDSLTEGYGIAPEQAYPFLLEKSLQKQGYKVRVINGGESGSTSAGGISRLPWYWRQSPNLVFIALGANDGLRGQDINALSANLQKMVDYVTSRGAKAMLVGIQIPPNYGKVYTQQFSAVFPKVARDSGIPLLPFLMEGVAGHPDLMQSDGLHPNARGHVIMAKLVEQYLLKHFQSFLPQ